MSTTQPQSAVATKAAACPPAQPAPATNTFDGQVVSLTGNKLVMKNPEGKEYSHMLDKDAQITCDGEVCRPEELLAGRKVRVTTRPGDRRLATGIEALNKQTAFVQASC